MKNNTNELKKSLTGEIRALVENTFFEVRKGSDAYPYVVYSLSQLSKENGCIKYELEINVVDKGNTTTRVDDLADSLEEKFDCFDYRNNKISYYTYASRKQTIFEEEKNIRRRRLLFELNFYSKEE